MLNANRRFKAAALGKITFGNILMTLLCLGTFAVAGLMYMMYQQVISTPETTAASYQRDQNAAASNPELMLPNGKTYRRSNSLAKRTSRHLYSQCFYFRVSWSFRIQITKVFQIF